MALDRHYIQAFTIEDVLLDKDTGAPMSGGLVYFYKDQQRSVLKPVYELTGTSPNYTYTQLPNPVVLTAIGTFEDAGGNPKIPYFFPYDDEGNIELYYIYVTNADGVPQFAREAQPYVFETALPPDQIISGDNELNNPQFVEVSFNPQSSYVYSFTSAVNEEVQLAPNWTLVASGTGSITVQRIALTEVNTPSNPPYVIDINSSGLSSFVLRQRLENSPRLGARGFVAGYFIASSEDNLQHNLQMQYNPSGGTLDSNVIIDATITSDGTYNELQGNLDIVGTINPDSAIVGYVDIDITIPVGAHIRVSSFQLVNINVAENIAFDEISTQKQKNGLFQYYENQTVQQSRDNLLVNWGNIKISQFSSTALANVSSQCSYVADQTILYQTGANALQFGISAVDNFVIRPQAGASDCRFALIQYIDPSYITGYSGYYLSSLIRALLETSQGTTTRLKVRLIWRNDAPPTIGASEPIATWTNGADPIFSAGWTAVAPLNDPAYSVSQLMNTTLGADTTPAYTFDQLQMPNTGADLYVGLVVYIMDPLDSDVGDPDIFYLNRMSLTNTQFGVDANPITYAQNLINCEFYYEKSYPYNVLPGTATDGDILQAYQFSTYEALGGQVVVNPTTFQIDFHTPKRAIPAVRVYANNGNADSVTAVGQDEAAGPVFEQIELVVSLGDFWNAAGAGANVKRIHYPPITLQGPGISGFTGTEEECNAYLIFHYTADARLGI